ncbi:chemotaxis protein CheD [Janthinobacterium psychrotolerans]|uniref:Chemotaxis protein CheD n=1 Tax=Janthinobacterium psychrotolerans TaxID=1747903 RepID=A0A1A7C225_9BURK|nr:chemotaxis protein CheD [Janthinobacterium psychrotolerans]OBV38785.1 chemotaxis protein CheD [Janthinobacterium psychrotolerans]
MTIAIDTPRKQVGMGQLSVGAHDDQLQALLGSCIGIGLLWKKGGRCGLAHCLLPEAPTLDGSLGARYVNQAVPSLLRLMGVRLADYADIDVVLAGGASMFGGRNTRLQVGRQNVEAAQKYLERCGLHVGFCALGGCHGRQLLIDCADQSYAVTEVAVSAQRPGRASNPYAGAIHGHA